MITVLVVLTATGKVFYESYIVKNALGAGYSPRPAMDGDAVDAVTCRNLLHYLMMTTRPSAHGYTD